MNLWNHFAGTVRVRIISAAAGKILAEISGCGITIEKVIFLDELTAEFTVLQYHYPTIKQMVKGNGDTIETINKSGVFWSFCSLIRRPVLVLGILLYITLALLLPSRILFVCVKGNESVSTEEILTKAEDLGICLGAYRRTVKSENVKNALLSVIPQLQWAGINTRGCVAEISVHERSEQTENSIQHSVSSIIAKCDGIVQEITVRKGNAQCKVGEPVKKGQVLVSGYTDCGIHIKATAADAEIYANTVHHLHAISPCNRIIRSGITDQSRKFSIIIGKNLIKLYNHSGISDTSCVKMCREYYVSLPGGYQIPLGVRVETEIQYGLTENVISDGVDDHTIEQTEMYLKQKMLAGKILSTQTALQKAEDVLYLDGTYYCYEMIGKQYYEEIITDNEQRSRKEYQH